MGTSFTEPPLHNSSVFERKKKWKKKKPDKKGSAHEEVMCGLDSEQQPFQPPRGNCGGAAGSSLSEGLRNVLFCFYSFVQFYFIFFCLNGMTSALPSYRRTRMTRQSRKRKRVVVSAPCCCRRGIYMKKVLLPFSPFFFFCIDILLEARHLIQRRLREFGHFPAG